MIDLSKGFRAFHITRSMDDVKDIVENGFDLSKSVCDRKGTYFFVCYADTPELEILNMLTRGFALVVRGAPGGVRSFYEEVFSGERELFVIEADSSIFDIHKIIQDGSVKEHAVYSTQEKLPSEGGRIVHYITISNRITPGSLEVCKKAKGKVFGLVIAGYYFDGSTFTHGVSHTYRVLFWTIVLSQMASRIVLGYKKGNMFLAACAAIIHDMARNDDGPDPEHGKRATATKREALEEIINHKVSDSDWKIIADAVSRHTEGTAKPGSVAAILMDADALDLVRLGVKLDPSRLRHSFTYGYEVKARCLYLETEAMAISWTALKEIGEKHLHEYVPALTPLLSNLGLPE